MATSEGTQQTKVAWFDERPIEGQITDSSRRLLETYSGIAPDAIEEHVIQVRNEAWRVHPYPCIGQFRFLEPGLSDLEQYSEVLKRLGEGQKLLDMACCFGQTIRQLIADGAPAANVIGCDLQPDFIELGYKLFKDRDKLQSKFLTADIFDPISALVDLKGQVDMIYTGSFFHLWGLEKQKEVSKLVASLLRPQQGSMILGRQIGAVNAVERSSASGTMYRHNVQSFKKLWKEIEEEMGVRYVVEAKLEMLKRDHFMVESDDTRRIWFTISRE